MKQPSILTIGDIATSALIQLRKKSGARISLDVRDRSQRLSIPFNAQSLYDRVNIIPAVGAASNVAIACARLGASASIMTYMGDDAAGTSMLQHLQNNHVDTSQVIATPHTKSNYWYTLHYGKEPTQLVKAEHFSYQWQQPQTTPDAIYLGDISDGSWQLHESLSTYLTENPSTTFAFQPGSQHLRWGSQRLSNLYKRTDILLLNKTTAETLLQSQLANIEEVMLQLHKLGPKTIIITDGPHKAHISSPEGILSLPTYPKTTEIIDRTGAGDAFAATVIAALLRDQPLTVALQHAMINSMNVCQHIGPHAGLLSQSGIDTLLAAAPASFTPTIIAAPTEPTMEDVAKRLVAKPKGIFAADESGGSIEKRFKQFSIPFTEENRRLYRQLFFTTPQIEQYISGIILFDETARQTADDGTSFIDLIRKRNIMPGIKVDTGLVALPGFENETVTSGLDGLAKRLEEYYEMGLRFAKWRAAFVIDGDNGKLPSNGAIAANVHALTRYAMECQHAGIVPIIEPEVVHTGNFSLETCQQATAKILDVLFDEIALFNVNRKALILKVNMVLAGSERPATPPQDVAQATVQTLTQHVPHDVAGVVFLSGGQSVEQATENLQAITALGKQPWPITFSYARALQEPAIAAWGGNAQHTYAAQRAFLARAAANSAATK